MSPALRIVVALAVLSGCARPMPAAPRTPPPSIHPADSIEVTRFLPASTAAFVVASSLTGLLEDANYHRWRRILAEPFERAALEIADETGTSPLAPSWLAEIGVDLHGPAGVAVLRGAFELWPVMFVRLADPGAFKAALYRTLGSRRGADLDLEVTPDALVIRGHDLHVVVRHDTALIADEDAALVVATQSEATSLRYHRGFREALNAVARRTLVGYVDVRGLVYAEAGLDPRWGGTDLAAAQKQLDARHAAALSRAAELGATAAVVLQIDRDFRQARAALAHEGGEQVRALFGAIEGLGLSLALEPHGAELQALLAIEGDAPIARLFVEGPACDLTQHVSGQPGIVFEGRLDLGAALALARQIGQPLAVLEPLGGAGALAAALDGSFCGAASMPDGLAKLTSEDDLAFDVAIGVRDPATIRTALERLAEIGGGIEARAEADGYVLDLGDRKLAVTFSEGMMSLTTERDAKVATGDVDPGHAGTDGAPLLARDEPRSLAGAMSLGLPLVLAWYGRDVPGGPLRAGPVHNPDVPKSEAYEQKRAELEAADAAIVKVLRAGWETARTEAALHAEALGSVSVLVRPEPGVGVRFSGRWRASGDPITALAALIGLRRSDPWADPAIDRLLEERAALQGELDGLYFDLAAAYLRAKTPPAEE